MLKWDLKFPSEIQEISMNLVEKFYNAEWRLVAAVFCWTVSTVFRLGPNYVMMEI